MNRLNRTRQAQVIAALVEGNSINSVVRMTCVSKVNDLKAAKDLGRACADYHDKHVRNLKCKRIQCDEICQFCYAKAKNVPEEKRGRFGYGDVWTWVTIDADTKLVPAYVVGNRDALTASMLINYLASSLAYIVQLTTDGLRVYLDAVEGAFGCDIDYAMLQRIYESSQEETRYSPARCVGCELKGLSARQN